MIMSRNHKVMHISCLHPWNDTRILFREAKTLSKEHDVELHAVADFKTRVYEGVIIVGLRKKKNLVKANTMVHTWLAFFTKFSYSGPFARSRTPALGISFVFFR